MLAARNAATSVPQGEVEELDRRFQEASSQLARNGDARVLEPIDWAIHDLVVRHADNELLQDALRTIHHHVQWVGGIAGIGARRIRESFGEHQEIMKALLCRDGEAAGEAMRRHLLSTKAAVLRYLEGITGSPRLARASKTARRTGIVPAPQASRRRPLGR
jgi:DNA-binding GntR family transcriptional regulator